MFNIPVSVQVSSSNVVLPLDSSHTPNRVTDDIHPMINEKDGCLDHVTNIFNDINFKKTPRGPPPVPPPKPPDLMKKGVSNISQCLPSQVKQDKTNSNGNSGYNLCKKPIKPPKPAGLYNKVNSHVHANPISERPNSVNLPDQEIIAAVECSNGNNSQIIAIESDDVRDENANVPEAEHITNNYVMVASNSLADHDSPGNTRTFENVTTTHNGDGSSFDSKARDALPPSHSSSKRYNAGNVSRETATNGKLVNSSSFSEGKAISRSISAMTSSTTGLNRRNSNIEKITSQITTSHIKRSFSARSEFNPKLLGSSSSPFNSSSAVIKPAKSTASVDSDDSSDEMDVKIELSVGLQRELRQFLEKRKFKVSYFTQE